MNTRKDIEETIAALHSKTSPNKILVAQDAINHILDKFGERINGSSMENPFVLGLGTGSTVAVFWPLFLQALYQRHHPRLPPIFVIPTSQQSRTMILNSPEVILGDQGQFGEITCLVDGFDVYLARRNLMIKGGGGAHVREKVIARQSKYRIYIGTRDKLVKSKKAFKKLPIPVEVCPFALTLFVQTIENSFDCAWVFVRESSAGSGKIGPVISDSGNLIVDVHIECDWYNINTEMIMDYFDRVDELISKIPGVLGTGIFCNFATKLFRR